MNNTITPRNAKARKKFIFSIISRRLISPIFIARNVTEIFIMFQTEQEMERKANKWKCKLNRNCLIEYFWLVALFGLFFYLVSLR